MLLEGGGTHGSTGCSFSTLRVILFGFEMEKPKNKGYMDFVDNPVFVLFIKKLTVQRP